MQSLGSDSRCVWPIFLAVHNGFTQSYHIDKIEPGGGGKVIAPLHVRAEDAPDWTVGLYEGQGRQDSLVLMTFLVTYQADGTGVRQRADNQFAGIRAVREELTA